MLWNMYNGYNLLLKLATTYLFSNVMTDEEHYYNMQELKQRKITLKLLFQKHGSMILKIVLPQSW